MNRDSPYNRLSISCYINQEIDKIFTEVDENKKSVADKVATFLTSIGIFNQNASLIFSPLSDKEKIEIMDALLDRLEMMYEADPELSGLSAVSESVRRAARKVMEKREEEVIRRKNVLLQVNPFLDEFFLQPGQCSLQAQEDTFVMLEEMSNRGYSAIELSNLLNFYKTISIEKRTEIWKIVSKLSGINCPIAFMIDWSEILNSIPDLEEIKLRGILVTRLAKYDEYSRVQTQNVLNEVLQIPLEKMHKALTEMPPWCVMEVQNTAERAFMFRLYIIASAAYKVELSSIFRDIKEKNRNPIPTLLLVESAMKANVKKLRICVEISLAFQRHGCTEELLPFLFIVLKNQEDFGGIIHSFVLEKIKDLLFRTIIMYVESNALEGAAVFRRIVEENRGFLQIYLDENLGLLLEGLSEQAEGKRNAITIHQELRAKERELVTNSVANVQVGEVIEQISLEELQKLAGAVPKECAYKDLPMIDKNILKKVMGAILQRLQEGEESDKERLALQLANYGDVRALFFNITSPQMRVEQILSYEGKLDEKAPFITAKLYEIVKKIEESSLEKTGELSEQEHLVLSLARSVYTCNTGQEEGIAQMYALFKKEERQGIFINSEEEEFCSLLQSALQDGVEMVETLLSSDNPFMRRVIANEGSFSQLTHQTAYLKSLLKAELKLTHDPVLDLHGKLIDPGLSQMSKEEVLSIFYEEYGKELLKKIENFFSYAFAGGIKEKEKKLLYNRLLGFLEEEDPSAILDVDAEYNVIGITPYGAQKILEKLGVFTPLV